MRLKRYKAKRNLKLSKEPKAKIKNTKNLKLSFVIHEHHATHLHYDLRLEVNGVLKSWALPKSPLDLSKKHLAIMVEDHPYEYKNFHGIISSGYGAGTVKIWDKGTYNVDGKDFKESQKLMVNGIKKGHFHFFLKGKKMKGLFALVRIDAKTQKWLFFKKQEES